MSGFPKALESCASQLRIALVLFVFFPAISVAVDQGVETSWRPRIEAYEPNYLGYAWQDEDVGFVDIGLSLKYQLLPERIRLLTCRKLPDGVEDSGCHDTFRAYLTFTGRFGFYVRTRASDPVIAKTFNPKLLFRYTPRDQSPKTFRGSGSRTFTEYGRYYDFAYAHESNGQNIDAAGPYLLEQRRNEDPRLALDRVSRGWDYVQVVAKESFLSDETYQRLAGFLDLKYFLPDGFIQGRAEEYYDFENDREGKRRRAVDGIAATLEYEFQRELLKRARGPVLSDPRFLLKYGTGYDPAFRYHTIRLEVGATFFELPIALWYEDGYGSSLSRYYKRLSAIGIQLRMAE